MIFGGRKQREQESRDALEQVALFLQRSNFNDFLEQQQRPRHLLWKNFLAGLARGFGAVIGATILVALFLGITAWAGGLPYVGELFSALGDAAQGD